jgi:hypothetical protein
MSITTEKAPWWLWPTRAYVTCGVERYFLFLQYQGDFHRKVASSWVAAVARHHVPSTPEPGASGTPQPPPGDSVAGHTHAGEGLTSDPAEQETTNPLAELQLERNDLFENLIDGLIDEDILATTR